MKNLSINFREPSADRFMEILAVAAKFHIPVKANIRNMPEGYRLFIWELLPSFEMNDFETCDFCLEYPENVRFDTLFANERIESAETIKQRIEQTKQTESKGLNDRAALALLKNGIEKLQLKKDMIQVVVYLSYVISCLDRSAEIRAEHIGEAIQYSKNVSQ